VVLPAVPNTNRGLIENLFLLSHATKPDRKSGVRSGEICGFRTESEERGLPAG
jgi:hypothetical protein